MVPRHLDAAERERTVITAAWRVIVRDGVAALTVRNVAAEAELAPSSLRYTFPTQAVVREKALRSVSRFISERVAALPESLAGRRRARAALLELLPLDDERRLEMEVFLALGLASLTDDPLRPIWIEADTIIRNVCAEAVGLVAGRRDRVDVDQLHALIDGLALHLLVEGPGRYEARARAAVDRHLEVLEGAGGSPT